MNKRLDAEISVLETAVGEVFPNHPMPTNLLVADGIGDDFGRGRVEKNLTGAWRTITWEKIDACGPDLLYHLSATGLLFFLPAFLTHLLQRRYFGWFEEALIPATQGYEDVASYFSGGELNEPFGDTAKRYFDRVKYVRARLTPGQRECVAKYIEIAETYRMESLTAEFTRLLKRYTDFWRVSSNDMDAR